MTTEVFQCRLFEHTFVVLHMGSSLQCAHKELNQKPHQLQIQTTFTAKDDCLESEMSRV